MKYSISTWREKAEKRLSVFVALSKRIERVERGICEVAGSGSKPLQLNNWNSKKNDSKDQLKTESIIHLKQQVFTHK